MPSALSSPHLAGQACLWQLLFPVGPHVDLVPPAAALGADHTAFGMTIFRDLILSVCIAIGFIVAVDSLMWLWDLGANGKLVAPWLSAAR
jgi:hypothetical protein